MANTAEGGDSTSQKIVTPCGNMYVTITSAGEVFADMGKSGRCVSCIMQSIAEACTVAVQSGASMKRLGEKLRGHNCNNVKWLEGMAESCMDGIGIALEHYAETHGDT
jgi:hypothetical protein